MRHAALRSLANPVLGPAFSPVMGLAGLLAGLLALAACDGEPTQGAAVVTPVAPAPINAVAAAEPVTVLAEAERYRVSVTLDAELAATPVVGEAVQAQAQRRARDIRLAARQMEEESDALQAEGGATAADAADAAGRWTLSARWSRGARSNAVVSVYGVEREAVAGRAPVTRAVSWLYDAQTGARRTLGDAMAPEMRANAGAALAAAARLESWRIAAGEGADVIGLLGDQESAAPDETAWGETGFAEPAFWSQVSFPGRDRSAPDGASRQAPSAGADAGRGVTDLAQTVRLTSAEALTGPAPAEGARAPDADVSAAVSAAVLAPFVSDAPLRTLIDLGAVNAAGLTVEMVDDVHRATLAYSPEVIAAAPVLVMERLRGDANDAMALRRGAEDARLDNPEYFHPWALERSLEAVFVTDRVVSVRGDTYEDAGGAHPNTASSGVLWDRAAHREIGFGALFADPSPGGAAMTAVAAYATQEWRREMADRTEMILDDVPDAPSFGAFRAAPEQFANFTLMRGEGGGSRASGVQLIYSPYDLEPYAVGAFYLTLPASVLEPYLAPAYRDLFDVSDPSSAAPDSAPDDAPADAPDDAP